MAKVKDQHVLGILQLPGTLCELVVAQILGKWEHKAAVTPSHHHPNLRTGGHLQGHSRSWTSTQGTQGARPWHQPLKEALPQGHPADSQLPWSSAMGLGLVVPGSHQDAGMGPRSLSWLLHQLRRLCTHQH